MGFSKYFEQRKSMLKSSQGFFECILISGSKRRKEVASTQNGSCCNCDSGRGEEVCISEEVSSVS